MSFKPPYARMRRIKSTAAPRPQTPDTEVSVVNEPQNVEEALQTLGVSEVELEAATVAEAILEPSEKTPIEPDPVTPAVVPTEIVSSTVVEVPEETPSAAVETSTTVWTTSELSLEMSRAELNEKAKLTGIEHPEKFPNKQAVIDAITALATSSI